MGPRFREDDACGFNFQIARIKIRLRDLAARSARAVHGSFAQENRGRGECRVPVAPAASCAKVESTRVVTTVAPEHPGIPARNGFNGFLRALPGDRACLPPSSAD